jgi:murein DD-endopeptidase MepM/ murein hydrolase activator NlpD
VSYETPPQSRRELREREALTARASKNAPAQDAAGHVQPRPPVHPPTRTIVVRRPPVKKRKAASTALSFGALLFAGALLVGVSVPANAFMADSTRENTSTKIADEQSLAISADATVTEAPRSTYTVTSYAELLRARYGNRSYSYSVGSGPVQWPFPYAVPISDGFGERIAPCRGCSSFHKGTDFTPGAGTAIYSIAAGTVIYTEVSDRGMGNNVIISHVVNGTKVDSMYAHMQMNSSPLHVGDVVNVGDFVGLVGETGTAIGAHLHLEIHIKGNPVDPFAWLKANAAGG